MKPILLILTLLVLSFSLQAQDLKLGIPVGHTDVVNSAVFSPDGTKVLTRSWDKTARLWDVNSGKLIHTLEGHEAGVYSTVFSPDGSKILTTGKTVKLWDSCNGKLIQTFINWHNSREQEIYAAIFSSDGSKILAHSFSYVSLFNSSSGELIWWTKSSGQIGSAAFSPNGRKIVIASWDNVISILSSRSGKTINILSGHDDSVRSAVFDNTGKKILSASYDGTAVLWKSNSGKIIQRFEKHTDVIESAVFSSDGLKVLTASRDNTACIFEIGNGKHIHTLSGHTEDVLSAIFSPDNKMVLTMSLDNSMRLWDCDSGELIKIFKSAETEDINSADFSADGKSILTASGLNYAAHIWSISKGSVIQTFERHTSPINSVTFSSDGTKILLAASSDGAYLMDCKFGNPVSHIKEKNFLKSAIFSPDDKKILTTSWDKEARLWDSSSGALIGGFEGHSENINSSVSSAIYSPDSTKILTASWYSVRLWDSNSGALIHSLDGHNSYINSAIFSPDGKSILTTADEDSTALLWECESGKIIRKFRMSFDEDAMIVNDILFKDQASAIFSSDGSKVFTFYTNSGQIWDTDSGALICSLDDCSGFNDYSLFSPNDALLLLFGVGGVANIWDSKNGKLITHMWGHIDNINSAVFSPDGKSILTVSDDRTARVWKVPTEPFVYAKRGAIDLSSSSSLRSPDTSLFTLIGHSEIVRSGVFSLDGRKILTASTDGSIVLWDSKSGAQLIQQFYFDSDPNKWVHLHPSGLFDASPEAMKLMYWVKDCEIIEFSQLKDRYWLPGLWGKVMSGKELPRVQNMQELKLYPEVAVNTMNEHTLSVSLTKRDGGYGAVKILLNGKEINQDARGANFDPSLVQNTLKIDIKDHPYLKEGENKITVIAASENGINSRGVDNIIQIKKKEQKEPQFFAVLVGIGEYANDNINLKFPVADANAISKAVSLGAQNLFKDRSHVYTLTSDSDKRPTKENLKAVFDEIAAKAHSEDIILLYLAGHGISTSGDQGDFYFLTADAMSSNQEAYRDEQIRKETTISTNEWVEWLKEIPALKQVMILDACGSGKAVDNLIAMRDIDPSQIKAIDRMKDRTGMYIISGCAADAVSYEASQYGQGLLTYALLQGMKGAALKEDQYVDVSTILNHARESVPQLAKGIGGIQTPQLLQPKSGSFDIGILNDLDRKAILLANPKTVYVRSGFVDSEEFEDILNLSEELDKRLSQISSRGADADLVFFDARKFPNACKLSGGYQISNDKISLSLKIRCGEDLKEHQIEAKDKQELIDKIIYLLD
ncbi:caspase family protein [Crocinitomicaceae bacterium]|nr:caspase family protein [Crocinitomicaceae bacterium]